jgi:hypothetical protein
VRTSSLRCVVTRRPLLRFSRPCRDFLDPIRKDLRVTRVGVRFLSIINEFSHCGGGMCFRLDKYSVIRHLAC